MSLLDGGRVIRALSRASEPLNAVIRTGIDSCGFAGTTSPASTSESGNRTRRQNHTDRHAWNPGLQGDLDLAQTGGKDIMTVEDFRKRGIEKVLEQLPTGGKVYVTLDIDVLDMTLVPGCASAETGGLTYQELRDALAQISKQAQLVGFDILEIDPMLDVASNVTSGNPLYLKMKGPLPGMEQAQTEHLGACDSHQEKLRGRPILPSEATSA